MLLSASSIVLINLGGNYLVNVSVIDLNEIKKSEIYYVWESFPQVLDIIQRHKWIGANGCSVAFERKRRRINGNGRYFVCSSGTSDVVIKPDIDANTSFFNPDGVHENDVGLEFYLHYVKDDNL